MLTSFERFQNRLHGLPVDRAPNFDIFMAFGAHHIGAQLRSYYLDYRTLVQMNVAMIQDYQIDVAQAISDPYREAVDWGLKVTFPEDGLPLRVKPLIETPADLNRLKTPDPRTGKRMSDRLEAVRALKEQVGGQVPVMGWVEGALAEANDLRGDSELLTDLYDRPEWLKELLERVTEVEIEFARAQVEAGADIIGLGDAIASTISPKMYRTFALPYEQRIFAAVKEMGAIPRLHICGNTNKIVPAMAESGAGIIDLDWMVSFSEAAKVFQNHPNKPAICGNFDPVSVMLQGTEDEVYRATWACLEAGGPMCISAAGCEIPIGTPQGNIHAQNRALCDFLAAK
jgi:MtaA/CmuA family methyltransferase